MEVIGPERQRFFVAAEVSSFLRKRQKTRLARRLVKYSWLLAETRLRAELGDEQQGQRVKRIEDRLKNTPDGEKLLTLSHQIKDSLSENPDDTRRTLAKTITSQRQAP